MNIDLKEVREQDRKRSEGKSFQIQRMQRTKGLR